MSTVWENVATDWSTHSGVEKLTSNNTERAGKYEDGSS